MTRTPARTFVIADSHGRPELIQQALDDGGFIPGEDEFVYAGDLLDRGPDPAGCLELVERYATEVLVGNHELAVVVDFDMWGSEPQSRVFRQVLLDRVVGAASPDSAAPPDSAGRGAAESVPASSPAGAWKAATCCQGVLVTHAGVSAAYQDAFGHECGSDPTRLAEHLNQEFLAAVRRELETGDWDEDGIFGRGGPLWYRPGPWSSLEPLAGVRQVAGHTPPLPSLEAQGFWMVDPCVWMMLMDAPWRFRYAVIEDGEVAVVERELKRAVA